MAPLVSLKPAQFCKSGDLCTVRVKLPELRCARDFGMARNIDVCAADLDLGAGDDAQHSGGGHAGESANAAAAGGAGDGAFAGHPALQAPRHVKRLAFGGLDLEPEYLLDRLRHECAELELPCQAQEVRVHGSEVMRMEVCSAPPQSTAIPAGESSSSAGGSDALAAIPMVKSAPPGGAAGSGLRALVHVMPEGNDGTYTISLMRLVGDTFEFHSLYRSLRDRLTDITVPRKAALPLAGQPMSLN